MLFVLFVDGDLLTLACSSWQAIGQEADRTECDVILTKDAVAIRRHDLTLESTTDGEQTDPQ